MSTAEQVNQLVSNSWKHTRKGELRDNDLRMSLDLSLFKVSCIFGQVWRSQRLVWCIPEPGV